MSPNFSRSLRTLNTDSSPRRHLAFFLIVMLLGLWFTWFAISRVNVYASTSTARLETDHENHPVDAAVGGRIDAVRVAVGQVVHSGDVLIEFDAVAERLARGEEEARLAPATTRVNLLKEEINAQERALEGERLSAEAAIAQADVEAQRAVTTAQFAAEESNRMAELQRRSLISEVEALRAKNLATTRQSDAQAAELASRRTSRDLETREQDRLAQIARLRQEIATIEGTRAEALAASKKLGYDIERRIVRAPVAGRVVEVMPLTRGSVLRAGDKICTILPEGALRVVAFFPPAMALGRIHSGQQARVRLDGFPWTQYGSPSAEVSSVAGEPRDGTIRVELTLSGQHDPRIPLQHGLPAEVDIEIERVSPAALVMRSLGLYTRLAAAGP